MDDKKNILICPLDWGLGHATRCVPIINELLQLGHHIIIGADKNPLAFLKQEFPQLKTIVIPGYEVEYDEKGRSLKLFYESVKFYNFIKKEKQFIDQIIQENNIDMIISDNRYGLYSEKVESVIVTHQIYPKAPLGEKILHQKIEKLLGKFDEVWIPDNEDENNLSGDLAHLKSFKQKHKFIGALSRFRKPAKQPKVEYDICSIISGPEPQRTVFEELIFEQIKTYNLKAVVVRGLPNENSGFRIQDSGLLIFNHLPTDELQQYILKSKIVVCRSGYSSIMDLVTLGKNAILVATPGQTEQEYLAVYHQKKENFYSQKQFEFDLYKGMEELKNYSPNSVVLATLNLEFL